MQAQIYKIHSDFYYAKDEQGGVVECKLREILKKQKLNIAVGDYVEVDENNFIISVLKRKNILLRPRAANIDCALVVCAIREPELDFIQLNRYLTYLKYNKIEAYICFNKTDLASDIELIEDKISSIYKKLGYKIFFSSAKMKNGIESIKRAIKNKTIVLCGMSGVGKSTLLNALVPEAEAKVANVSHKNQRGRHTTRHCEIVEYSNFKIVDTPGFSCLRFDFLLPNELIELFDDLKKYKDGCKYSNCLHNVIENSDCAIVRNLDKTDISRYESYLMFLDEALEYKNRISKTSIKNEANSKNTGHRTLTKISKKKRELSRKTQKQRLDNEQL